MMQQWSQAFGETVNLFRACETLPVEGGDGREAIDEASVHAERGGRDRLRDLAVVRVTALRYRLELGGPAGPLPAAAPDREPSARGLEPVPGGAGDRDRAGRGTGGADCADGWRGRVGRADRWGVPGESPSEGEDVEQDLPRRGRPQLRADAPRPLLPRRRGGGGGRTAQVGALTSAEAGTARLGLEHLRKQVRPEGQSSSIALASTTPRSARSASTTSDGTGVDVVRAMRAASPDGH